MNFVKLLKNNELALYPADDKAIKFFNKLGIGEMTSHDVYELRNGQQLKMFWALCRSVADNYREDKFKDLDTARKVCEYIKLKLGYVDYRIVMGDHVHIKSKSISYSKMPQEEWKKFLDDAMPIIETLGGVSAKDIEVDHYDGDIEDDR